MTQSQLCPCGSQQPYANCCQPYHQGLTLPDTCEQLMRSRYAAYAMVLGDYLVRTHEASFLGDLTQAQIEQSANDTNWVGLEILGTDQNQDKGWVEFRAWFQESDDSPALACLHEVSDFVRKDGAWLYTTGQMKPSRAPGRNDPCPCGSGKKYKKCDHGA